MRDDRKYLLKEIFINVFKRICCNKEIGCFNNVF